MKEVNSCSAVFNKSLSMLIRLHSLNALVMVEVIAIFVTSSEYGMTVSLEHDMLLLSVASEHGGALLPFVNSTSSELM